jgi:hypothetical protein
MCENAERKLVQTGLISCGSVANDALSMYTDFFLNVFSRGRGSSRLPLRTYFRREPFKPLARTPVSG